MALDPTVLSDFPDAAASGRQYPSVLSVYAVDGELVAAQPLPSILTGIRIDPSMGANQPGIV
jgi:hypothetical protein